MNEHIESSEEGATTADQAIDVVSELGGDTDREILTVLVADSPRHVMDIASAVDRHPITVDLSCSRLHEHGQIHPVGRGLYGVTEAGKRRIVDNIES